MLLAVILARLATELPTQLVPHASLTCSSTLDWVLVIAPMASSLLPTELVLLVTTPVPLVIQELLAHLAEPTPSLEPTTDVFVTTATSWILTESASSAAQTA